MAVLGLGGAAPAPAAPVSSHAMIHACCTPAAMKERIFAESKALGAAYIRVDIEMNDIFEAPGGEPRQTPSWKGVDEVVELSRHHDLPVLGILLAVPAYLSSCPERWPHSARCPAADLAEYGRLVGAIAERGRGAIGHWEVVNEPDGEWAFEGSPEEYAGMLSSARRAIREHAPESRVVLGGVMRPHDQSWLERVFATPNADAAHSFDIANVHLRGTAGAVIGRFGEFRALLARHGFSGPLWVTEHGYPADPAFQADPTFSAGEPSQAAYLTETLVGLGEAGADQVFVTLRDNLGGEYASEGLIHIDEAGDFPSRRRLAFGAVRRVVDSWEQLMAWRAEQRLNERLEERHATAATLARLAGRIARSRLRDARALVRESIAAGAGERRLARARAVFAEARAGTSWQRAMASAQRARAGLHALAAADLRRRIAGG